MKSILSAVLLAATAATPLLAQTPATPAADAMFKEPYVDIDEWRTTPVRHRYVHGGFKGTGTKFSLYLPPKERFQGRFFQYVTPVPDSENLSQTVQAGDDNIGFAASSGAYFVETNGGGTAITAGPAFMTDPTIGAYRANAAVAEYSRKLASEMYGVKRIYGYIYGGSGGAYRTFGSIENTTVWDGAVPFVAGSPMASPNNFSIRMHAMRLLKDKFPGIIDAMDSGGSGDPYAGLNAEQAAALREATRMGFPLQSWFGYKTMGVHGFTAVYQGMVMADPTYFEDFWTKPGYLGFDNPATFAKARLQFPTTVKLALSATDLETRGLTPKRRPGQPRDDGRGTADLAWKALVNDGSARTLAFELGDTPPDVDFIGGDLYVLSGEAKGKRIALLGLNGKVATLGVVDLATVAKLKAGDQVRIDNSNFLAAQTYHRHQVPDASYYTYNQFRGTDGMPLYPQRRMLLGPLFARGAAGTVPTGKFNGKIILVESGLDREAFAWNADWYAHRFDEHFGKDAPNRYRVWFTDRALHGYNEDKDARTRVVSYLPVLQQALRDVSAWVEKGMPPPANTGYRIDDGQVVLAPTAAARKGIQPVVSFARGRVLAKAGLPVKLTATIDVPPATGKIIAAAWDFDGSGSFAEKGVLPAIPAARATVSTTHSFAKPGTYFVTLRVESERSGNAASPYARIPNLARVRVVVR
ncbi:PKD domain-containing protein [Sphingomonas sp. SUN039]|uniref:PKD domain-containing protein n=1 Tax=Sphingomonas sp. SUN039 TaxID=2937787 RepID=UPI002164C8F2|nr:PKD domain-containing protein [Sphingomonas sp. SUN039]UVO54273.1 PKD domain-containing protein [Sphingomonas sp. SUN039]